jgi:hypothetical protein
VDIQAALYHRKFNKLRVFLGLGENRAEVRAAVLADIGLSTTDGHLARQQVALVLAAWDAAKEYVTKENSVRAEARASNLPGPCRQRSTRQCGRRSRHATAGSRTTRY